nr:MAG TPA: IrrE protein [Caudoviricetes sp.]DAY14323.1 MAG TPA: IrrE protein [Caudoviricetes sp.]
MRLEDICHEAGVTLAYFDNELWRRPGMIIDELKIVFVNKALSEEAQKRVILHEIAHLNHSKAQYTINPIKCENEANRAMIRALIREELDEGHEFNYIRFMERHKLKTTTDEIMVVDEYFSLIG